MFPAKSASRFAAARRRSVKLNMSDQHDQDNRDANEDERQADYEGSGPHFTRRPTRAFFFIHLHGSILHQLFGRSCSSIFIAEPRDHRAGPVTSFER